MNTDSSSFLSNLAEIHDSESRIAMALSKMNKADISADLKMEILSHRKETERNITGVEEMYNHFNGRAGEDHPETSAQYGLKHTQDLILKSSLKSLHDSGLPNNDSHRAWESVSYECLHEWESLMGSVDAANLLEAIVEDERNEAPFEGWTGSFKDRCPHLLKVI